MKINLNEFPYSYGEAVSSPIASEGNCSFTLDNRSKFVVKRWEIDKVVFKNRREERCDFLLQVQNPDKWVYYWIELKGKDLAKACRQIMSTISFIDNLYDIRQEARVVTTGTNKIDVRDIKYQKLDKIMRKTGGRLRSFTNKALEII